MFLFDIPRLENELAELEKETSNPDFWNNSENTQKVLAKIKKIKSKYTKYKELEKEINNLIELAEMVKLEYDEELAIDVTNNYKKQEKKIWNSQLAIENPKNDRIAVIYSVKVSSVRILEKPRNPKRGKTR